MTTTINQLNNISLSRLTMLCNTLHIGVSIEDMKIKAIYGVSE